jgi:hypothetical protein
MQLPLSFLLLPLSPPCLIRLLLRIVKGRFPSETPPRTIPLFVMYNFTNQKIVKVPSLSFAFQQGAIDAEPSEFQTPKNKNENLFFFHIIGYISQGLYIRIHSIYHREGASQLADTHMLDSQNGMLSTTYQKTFSLVTFFGTVKNTCMSAGETFEENCQEETSLCLSRNPPGIEK